jgi:hypothetical protein
LVIEDACMCATRLLTFRSVFEKRADVRTLMEREKDDVAARAALRRKAALLAAGDAGAASAAGSDIATHAPATWSDADAAKLAKIKAAIVRLDGSMLRLDETLLLLGALRALERL